MDLSQLSTDDLKALQGGDLSKVSTAGLRAIQAGTKAQADTAAWQATVNPATGGVPLQIGPLNTGLQLPDSVSNFLSATGKGITDYARGAGERLGLVSPQDVAATRTADAPLMATTAGKVGNFAGKMLPILGTALIPGANTYAGAAAIGATQGLLEPTTADESVVGNTALGGAGGFLGTLGTRAAVGIVNAGKAAVQPFYAAGRDQIAGNLIARFADNPGSVAGATSTPTITGALPTLAEQTGDRGIARLQDSLASVDPQINNQIAGRLASNNASRVQALQGLTGADGARDFAVANRAGTAQPMYDDAFKVVPDASLLTPDQGRSMQTLLKSPAVQQAMKDAQAIAKNQGTNVGPANASGSIEGLHNMKLSLDDQIAAAQTAGLTNKAASIKTARDNLVDLMESMSPEYANARQVYAQMSQPINSMDVASQIARRGLSKGTDLSGNPTINRNALIGAIQDPNLVKQATGRSLGTISDVMDPQDEALVRAIASEADRAGAVAQAGNGPGSATAQRIASQNITRNLIGSFGAPGGASEGWMGKLADSVLANTALSKPMNLIYGGIAEPAIQKRLAQAVLDPATARSVLAAAQRSAVKLPASLLQRLTQTAAQELPAASATDR